MGRIRPPLYDCWRGMMKRCYNPNDKGYPDWGGRGIRVCAAWRESFAAFTRDVGPKPHPDLSIDRIDFNGDYCPENCRWADDWTQLRNRRGLRHVSILGETKLLSDWGREPRAVSIQTIHKRLAIGMDPAFAVWMPSNRKAA